MTAHNLRDDHARDVTTLETEAMAGAARLLGRNPALAEEYGLLLAKAPSETEMRIAAVLELRRALAGAQLRLSPFFRDKPVHAPGSEEEFRWAFDKDRALTSFVKVQNDYRTASEAFFEWCEGQGQ